MSGKILAAALQHDFGRVSWASMKCISGAMFSQHSPACSNCLSRCFLRSHPRFILALHDTYPQLLSPSNATRENRREDKTLAASACQSVSKQGSVHFIACFHCPPSWTPHLNSDLLRVAECRTFLSTAQSLTGREGPSHTGQFEL